jgi:uncharacterized protein YjbI with pentapeptide repeats
MNETIGESVPGVDLRGQMPELMFERKLYLSIQIHNTRYYVAKTPADQHFIPFSANRADAQLLALYRVRNAPADTFMLQAVPNDEAAFINSGFLALWGLSGFGYGSFVHMADALRFTALQSGNDLRMKVTDKDFLLAGRMDNGVVTFWTTGPSIFDGATWLTETTTRWSGNMDGADLRHVEQLRNVLTSGISLARADLRRADLSRVNTFGNVFTGARFGDTRFIGATLNSCTLGGIAAGNTNFTDAVLLDCGFESANLTAATFANTNFQRSRLGKAKFNNCNLAGCKFPDAKLEATDFTGATLTGTEFQRAEMKEVILTDAKAQRADFTSAKLNDAKLGNAELQGAKFNKAVLIKAGLANAKLGESNGQRTDFREAKLYEIDFSDCDLRSVTMDQPSQFQENGEVTPATRRRALLCRAKVPLAVLGTASWRMLDLTGAEIASRLPAVKGFNGDYCNFPDNFDLQKFDLSFARFRYASLVGAKLQETRADGAEENSGPDFSDANLRSAQFHKADLFKAKFDNAKLYGAKLANGFFDACSFRGARLESLAQPNSVLTADLSGAFLMNASFENANVGRGTTTANGANFSNAIFFGEHASLSNATLDGAQFGGAYLASLDFTGGTAKAMDSVNFANACLANCKFQKAALTNVVLTQACLLGTDFTDAQLLGAQMSGANVSLTRVGIIKIKRPDGYRDTLDCGPTLIQSKSTNGDTTCPAGGQGPCTPDTQWQRASGVVLRWPSDWDGNDA